MPLRHTQVIMRPRKNGGQSVAYTGTAGTITNAVAQGIDVVKVNVTTDAYVSVSGTATTSDCLCLAGVDYWFPIPSGGKVSAIQLSSGGTLYVCEMTQ